MSPMPPRISVVIPAYNRVEPLKYTLRSVARAAERLNEPVEILLVDDGSNPPIEAQLQGFDAGISVSHVRQANSGSIVARLRGLEAATGDCVLFLDSDDLIHPDKLLKQLAAMAEERADISYADMAEASLGPEYGIERFAPAEVLPKVDQPAKFFIDVQPAPHNPIFRRSYLRQLVATPIVPAMRPMDPSGDVWLYYNLAPYPAKIVKVNAPLSAPGPHGEDRYSRHWERLGVSALLIMEQFMRRCPQTDQNVAARAAVGAAAFRSWRNLPRDFDGGFTRRMLAIYHRAPKGSLDDLGTPNFSRLARLLGPVAAGRLLRAFRAKPYRSSRTLSAEDYERLLSDLNKHDGL